MADFVIHTHDSAPEASKPLLDSVKQKFGMIPNLLGEMAEAPNVLKAYLELSAATAAGTLTPTQQQIVQIATSRSNGCHYCVAAHSTVADMQKLPADVINAVREGKPIADAKLQALHQFAQAVVSKQGWVNKMDVADFIKAGYSQAQVLEVILSVTLKTFSNYANHIIDTPVDQAFQPRAIDLSAMRKAS